MQKVLLQLPVPAYLKKILEKITKKGPEATFHRCAPGPTFHYMYTVQ